MMDSTSASLGRAAEADGLPPSTSSSLPPQIPTQDFANSRIEMSELENPSKAVGAEKGLASSNVSMNPDQQHDLASPTGSSTTTAHNPMSTTTAGEENTRPAVAEGSNEISVAQFKQESLSQPPATTSTSGSSSTPIVTTPAPPTITRLDSVAIGPSTDAEIPPPSIITASEADSTLVITLLLTSGARHPYKIDEKYLTKRNVNVLGVTEQGKKDPYSISVYTLKELILREWREEWEVKPSSPSSIRLIYFGKLLDDKTALKEYKFNAESTNVVHMTVRPQDIVDEEDGTKSKSMSRRGEDGESNAGCRCVIL